ncbi:MAG: type II toxin-antitoxin system MqsA family antitoxin [Deltaproteobacteria bacterium]|nr:type II toxin-antitoxin system MqsA family antitoxin [Deltaproteobacteria bacterium]
MKRQKCPICGAGVLTKRVGTENFEYKGQTLTVPDYVTYACNECGEAIVDPATLRSSGKKLKDFKRMVDGLLTGKQIKAIRLKLGLTQEQMADIIGGGLKSVARYESGQVCQSKGMDNLLRILDAFPETLKVIQQKATDFVASTRVLYMDGLRDGKVYQEDETSVFIGEKKSIYGV